MESCYLKTILHFIFAESLSCLGLASGIEFSNFDIDIMYIDVYNTWKMCVLASSQSFPVLLHLDIKGTTFLCGHSSILKCENNSMHFQHLRILRIPHCTLMSKLENTTCLAADSRLETRDAINNIYFADTVIFTVIMGGCDLVR